MTYDQLLAQGERLLEIVTPNHSDPSEESSTELDDLPFLKLPCTTCSHNDTLIRNRLRQLSFKVSYVR